MADIIANDQTLLSVEKTLKQDPLNDKSEQSARVPHMQAYNTRSELNNSS